MTKNPKSKTLFDCFMDRTIVSSSFRPSSGQGYPYSVERVEIAPTEPLQINVVVNYGIGHPSIKRPIDEVADDVVFTPKPISDRTYV